MNNNVTLMIRENPVLEFNIDDGYYKIISLNLLPYQLKGSIENTEGNNRHAERKNERVLIEFLSKRVLSLDRENAKKILNAYNLSQSQDPYTKAKIAIACKAISMTDSYWLNAGGCQWKDYNPRNMSLSEIVANVALHGKSLTLTGEPHTPEITGHGTYAKAWKRENDSIFLYKKGTPGNKEAEREVSVSRILDCFNVEHVKYELVNENNSVMSKCENMSTDVLGIVPAEDIYSYCNRNDIFFDTYIRKVDKDSISKMNIIDYLISNTDRHMMNWGFYQDNRTGNLLCCHPLFDHNNAFDEDILWEDKGSLVYPDLSMKEAALKGLKESEFHLTKQLTPDCFISKEHIESFMKKADSIGIYKKVKDKMYKSILPTKEYIPINYTSLANDKLQKER